MIILPKKKKLNMEGDITGLLEVTVQGSCLMKKYASREAFGFASNVIGSTRRCTIVKNFTVIVYGFNYDFSPDRGNPAKNITPLDEVDDGYTVSTCRALQFYSCIYPSAAVSTISGMNLNSAPTISIVSEHIAKR